MAVIVNAVQEVQHAEIEQSQQQVSAHIAADTQLLQNQLSDMQAEMSEIKALLKRRL